MQQQLTGDDYQFLPEPLRFLKLVQKIILIQDGDYQFLPEPVMLSYSKNLETGS